MLGLLVTLVIVGLIFAVLYWGLAQLPLPEPFPLVIRVLLALAVVIFLISLLTGGAPDWGNLGWHGMCP